MINKANGHIELPQYNTILAKGMTVDEMKQTAFYKESFKEWGGYYLYPYASFAHMAYKKYTISVAPRFSNDRLCHIDMFTCEDGDPKGWNEWDEGKEMGIYHRNNAFLEDELGYKGVVANRPYPLYEYIFDWGTVYSTFDIRSGGSMIGIGYK